jgi:hypothetical protein
MSKLFFDHLVEFEEIEKQIKKVAKTSEEREELWGLVDEIIHHKVIGCILDKLPRQHHEEFLELFHKSPHDEELLFGYLRKKVGDNIESLIKQEIGGLASELLEEIKSS